MADNAKGPATLRDVYEYLHNDLVCAGSPWTSGSASELPKLPGLHIKGAGYLSLPLTPRQFQHLKQTSESASSNMGDRMLCIGADQVSLKNPEWESALESLAKESAIALGALPDNATAELESLLVLGSGSEPSGQPSLVVPAAGSVGKTNPKTFATLIIQLPSRFEGGYYKISHDDDEESLFPNENDTAEYSASFLAAYQECQATVEVPSTGYRVALVYALNYAGESSEERPTVAKVSQDDLASLLNRLPSSLDFFCVPVVSSSFKNLQGTDRSMANALEGACTKSTFNWKVATAKANRTVEERGFFERTGRGTRNRDFRSESTRETTVFLGSIREFDGREIEVEFLEDDEIVLESMDEGGNALAQASDMEDIWKQEGDTECESEDTSYTFNQEVTRRTYYDASLLVVYRVDTEPGKGHRPTKRARHSVPGEVIVLDDLNF